jgi:hypothetical protein
MQRPTIQRPMTSRRRRPAGTFTRIQGAMPRSGRHTQPRRGQSGRRRGSQVTASKSGKGGLARRGGRLLAVSGAGAAIAYFLDRKEGKHRREVVRERAAEMTHRRHEHDGHQHNGSGAEQARDTPRVENPLQTPQQSPGGPPTPGGGMSAPGGTMGG